MLLGLCQSGYHWDFGMTVICCWDVMCQSNNGYVGDDSNMILRHGQSEYQWGCGG